MSPARREIVVVGSGNAGLCAAIAAAESGAAVRLLERAPHAHRGGNTAYSAGAFRFVYESEEDLLPLLSDVPEQQVRQTDFGTYPAEQYFLDMARLTEYRADPDLTEVLVRESAATMRWLQGQGIDFQPMYGRQTFLSNGRHRFYGGLTVESRGGGVGLVDGLLASAIEHGVEVQFDTRVRSVEKDGNAVSGVRATDRHGTEAMISSDAVVLAAGGFEANAHWRTRYLGPGWELAKVRGSRFNTGDGIRMGLAAGAASAGNWSGCHAVAWDRNAPDVGDPKVGDVWNRHSYPVGIVVNQRGQRFVDEGADLRNYTYARYGPEILKQPGQTAWQVFDAKVQHLLRDEYRLQHCTRVQADTLEELAARMEGMDAAAFLTTVEEYNRSVHDGAFDPSRKDGLGTQGLAVPKSNWANKLDSPPFLAYQVTCGITFTFGGVHISRDGEVLGDDGAAIPGLYAAGEQAAGLFYFNYPGGSGLMSGSVFGRRAGLSAALGEMKEQL